MAVVEEEDGLFSGLVGGCWFCCDNTFLFAAAAAADNCSKETRNVCSRCLMPM